MALIRGRERREKRLLTDCWFARCRAHTVCSYNKQKCVIQLLKKENNYTQEFSVAVLVTRDEERVIFQRNRSQPAIAGHAAKATEKNFDPS